MANGDAYSAMMYHQHQQNRSLVQTKRSLPTGNRSGKPPGSSAKSLCYGVLTIVRCLMLKLSVSFLVYSFYIYY